MPAISTPATVLVTGASGFIATWVVKTLLEKDYSVVGTVRSHSKGEYLRELYRPIKSGRFSYVIVEDIEKDGAFDEAVKGVDAVAHMASPVRLNVDDPNELIGPAVNGTLGILSSLKRSNPSVKRVVITSSVASIIHEKTWPPSGYLLYDETEWNTDSPKIVEKFGANAPGTHKYRASKVLAERAAWSWLEENKGAVGFDLVTICPPLVWGSMLQKVSSPGEINASVAEVYKRLLPTSSVPNEQLKAAAGNFVDVRDVSLAHVLALETESAGGQRFITGGGPFTWQDVLDAVHRTSHRPNAPKGIPGAGKDAQHFVYVTKKAEETFGIRFRGLDEVISATLTTFEERGL